MITQPTAEGDVDTNKICPHCGKAHAHLPTDIKVQFGDCLAHVQKTLGIFEAIKFLWAAIDCEYQFAIERGKMTAKEAKEDATSSFLHTIKALERFGWKK